MINNYKLKLDDEKINIVKDLVQKELKKNHDSISFIEKLVELNKLISDAYEDKCEEIVHSMINKSLGIDCKDICCPYCKSNDLEITSTTKTNGIGINYRHFLEKTTEIEFTCKKCGITTKSKSHGEW